MQTMASVSHCHGSPSGHLACSMIVRDANPNRNYLPLPRDTGGFRESSVGFRTSLSVRASAASGDALIGGGPARIEREAGLVDINDQRSMIRGYRLSFARLTVDLGPDDARL